jgi:hypothetical protein
VKPSNSEIKFLKPLGLEEIEKGSNAATRGQISDESRIASTVRHKPAGMSDIPIFKSFGEERQVDGFLDFSIS